MAKTLTFADLPAELRNQVYNYVMIESQPIELDYAYTSRPFEEPGLLMTSAWIRREAIAIYYGSNTFEAPSVQAAKRFLSESIAIGPNDGKIQRAMLVTSFRPVQHLVLAPNHERQRWALEALRKILNQVLACGLSPGAIQVARRGGVRTVDWIPVAQLQAFQLMDDAKGWPRYEWQTASSIQKSAALAGS